MNTISRLLKLQVSFAKEPYKRDDVLHKRPMILRSLLIVATPYRMKRVLQSHHSRRRSDFETFGSPNLSVFLIDLLSAGDSVYTRENLRVKIRGLP